MNNMFIKRVATVLIITFTFMTISPNYSFSQDGGIYEELAKAKSFYKEKNYEEAQEAVDRIISNYGGNKAKYTQELCSAYYLKAKIHFLFEETDIMREAFRDIYRISSNFDIPQTEDAEFLKIAYEEREKVRAEVSPKSEPVIIEINSTSKDVRVCVDELKPDQAELIGRNGIELDIKPGKHVFYFISENKYLKLERDVRTGDSLKFNLDFSKAEIFQVSSDGKVITQPGSKSKKKFPWLVVVAGVVAAGVVVYLLTAKKAKKTLSVDVGEGVTGNPASGSYKYKKGASVSYNYTAQNGYASVTVTLDGAPVAASGTITMDKDHTLSATATKEYTLTVTKTEGVNGTPESGTLKYTEGETVNYNYTLQEGYRDLNVTIDGINSANSGSITMDKDHVLNVSAGKGFSLAVTKGAGVDGTPDGGTFYYTPGATVNYSYTLKGGYKDLKVMVDSNPAPASGTIIMNGDHTLVALSDKEWTLTVTRGTGVDGSPISGTFTYKEGYIVTYGYELEDGYRDLVVTLDGTPVPASGTITMTKDCTLNATATKEYTLTVAKGNGITGTPETGTTKYKAGETVNYSYSLQTGYSDLNVTLDGNVVAASGTITMDQNHALVATSGKAYVLTVTKSTGIDGEPEEGTFIKNENEVVTYNYSLKTGYTDLVVKIDGIKVGNSGTITMTKNCTLSATASATHTLTTSKGTGVDGTPNSGSQEYKENTKVDYSYALQSGYKDLVVTIDGNAVPASGTITMKRDHALSASATLIPQYTLNVTRGTGVTGNPASGTPTYPEGTSVSYSYSLAAGYKTLTVTVDGNPVAASGTIIMNGNHTLIASATAVPQYTLTVNKGTGVDGTPAATTPYPEGTIVNYSYSLQAGYKDLVVTLDGNPAAVSGTITMNGNHTLNASATKE